MRSLEREPIFCLDPPSTQEVRSVLLQSCAPVGTYVLKADGEHPQNAWLYVCRNQEYTLEGLGSSARRDARRALRSFQFEFVDVDTLLQKGLIPYGDSWKRNGLSTGTPAEFQRRFEAERNNPACSIVGAWKGNVLAAFMWLLMVDDWMAIAAYAANEYLKFCPNNGLIHFAMDYFLAHRKVRCITYGLSSIQEIGKANSLHHFKCRVGFEAVPVHRVFAFHPLVRPLANSVVLRMLRLGVRMRPQSASLRKAAGLLATYLDKHPPLSEEQQ